MKIRKKLPSVLKYGALLLTIILLLFPIYWMVICSMILIWGCRTTRWQEHD